MSKKLGLNNKSREIEATRAELEKMKFEQPEPSQYNAPSEYSVKNRESSLQILERLKNGNFDKNRGKKRIY
jgi:hypothetical protein